MEQVWTELLNIVREEAGSRVVETWLKAIVLHEWDVNKRLVHLRAPNAFVRDWGYKNYVPMLKKHLARLLHVTDVQVSIIDASKPKESAAKIEPEVQAKNNNSIIAAVPIKDDANSLMPITSRRRQHTLNENYRFDTFVTGPSNMLAHSAAQAVADRPGQLYNPLFVYADSGLGKTHLLHAIGNKIVDDQPRVNVLYQPADRFVNEFINAIRFDRVHQFRDKYQNVDVLLIDDIQFISNKNQTQEAFFHIFNALYDARKQLVFSSDMFPSDIQGLADRLRSRLASGLVTDINAPSLEIKVAIVKRKASVHGSIIDDSVAHYIAASIKSNIRELEGAFIRVLAFASLTNKPITVELAAKVLERETEKKNNGLSMRDIMRVVGRFYGFGADEMCSNKRTKDIVRARQVAMFLMKHKTSKSLREIAASLDRKDHTTVTHAVEKIKELQNTDASYFDDIRSIERLLM